ncbi:hypothetical protein MICRO80W_540007 [Micrococcus luteus]|nr:hypothetical protein MICRO80W_540007 [Micrococcus luteus]
MSVSGRLSDARLALALRSFAAFGPLSS